MNETSEKNKIDSTNLQGSEKPFTIDYIFLIRRKKSFRYLIFSVVILTFCLWFSDRYLRFDLDETKYRIALTLENESARPIMRNISKKVFSNPNLLDDSRYLQYLEFLALIEEDDAVIKTYQDIYNISNTNTSFPINYITKLYFLREYNHARELIKEVQNLSPNNSLLGYLESAMVINPDTKDAKIFTEGISIIAKENRSGNHIIFPETLWHPTLPKYTYAYYLQKYNILNHCLAPLYELNSNILKRAELSFNESSFQNIQIGLEELFLMATKIGMAINIDDFYSNLPICITSLKLQKDILILYNRSSKTLNSPILEKGIRKLNKISNLLEKSEHLEEKRKKEFEEGRELRIKIIMLLLFGFIELFIIYLLGKLLYYYSYKSQSNPVLSNLSSSIYLFCIVWTLVIFIFLFYSVFLSKTSFNNFYRVISLWCLLIIFPFFAGIYSILHKNFLTNIHLNEEYVDEKLSKIENTKNHKFINSVSYFIEKFSGLLLGYYTIIICVLFLSFRIIYLSYPFQLNLIWDQTRFEEFNLIKEFLSFIHS